MSSENLAPRSGDELNRYLSASSALENTRSQIEALEQTQAVETFHSQLALLRRRLLTEPQAFRDMFIADGSNAMVWNFSKTNSAPSSFARCGPSCCAMTTPARC